MTLCIITVTFNNFEGLKKTIASINNQDNKDFINIIIDGNSTDETKNYLIELNLKKNNIILSEEDLGIYDAMNKGINLASNTTDCDYLIFLNAGDSFYCNNVISKFYKDKDKDKDKIYHGGTSITYHNNNFLIKSNDRKELSHQSVFIPIAWHKKNLYNLNLPICADRQLLLKATKELKVKNLDFYISNFELGGISNYNKSFRSTINQAKEICIIYNNHQFWKTITTYLKFFIRYLLTICLNKDLYFKLMTKIWFRKT